MQEPNVMVQDKVLKVAEAFGTMPESVKEEFEKAGFESLDEVSKIVQKEADLDTVINAAVGVNGGGSSTK